MAVVSVVIPTHDRRELLRGALASVAAQTLPDVEVVLVNDGGEDVADVVAEFEPRLAIDYVSYDQPRERCAARNLALERCRGTYVAYLDDDDVFYPHHLATLVDALERSGDAVAYSDGVECRVVVAPDGTRIDVDRRVLYAADFDPDRLLCENYIAINTVVHRRDCLELVGGFDEELGIPLEDWDLWIRLSRHWAFHHVPSATAEFRTRIDAEYTRLLDRSPFYVNAQRVFVKHAEHVRGRPDLLRRQVGYLSSIVDELARRATLATAPSRLEGARRWTALCFAEELLANPELLASYASVMEPDDDATLVVYAAAWTEARLRQEFVPMVAAAGISGDASADMLVIVDPPSPELHWRLAGTVQAVISECPVSAPFEVLPRFGREGLSALRRLAGLDPLVALA